MTAPSTMPASPESTPTKLIQIPPGWRFRRQGRLWTAVHRELDVRVEHASLSFVLKTAAGLGAAVAAAAAAENERPS